MSALPADWPALRDAARARGWCLAWTLERGAIAWPLDARGFGAGPHRDIGDVAAARAWVAAGCEDEMTISRFLNFLNNVTRGDALRLLAELPDACVDAVITDPPYSSGGQFRGDRAGYSTSDKYQSNDTVRTYGEFAGDTRDQRGYAYWCALWMSEAWRVAKPGAPILVFTDWRQLPTTTDAMQAGGWVWRGIVPWDKTEAARPQRGRFRAQCEYVVWGSKGQLWSDGRDDRPCLPGFIRKPVNSNEKEHIAGKPLAVMRALMEIAPPGGVVLDAFAGSGTTLKAAAEAGLQYIGFELDPAWAAASDRRTSVVHLPMFVDEPRDAA